VIERSEQLREAREASGLSLADVAQRLRLSVRHLEAIEAGDWDRLPGAAFARGAMRSYARLLSVDVEPLLRQLPSAQNSELLRPAPSLETSLPRGRSRRRFKFPGEGRLPLAWLILGLAAALVAAALLWPEVLQSVRESVRSRQSVSTATGAAPIDPGQTAPVSVPSSAPVSSATEAPPGSSSPAPATSANGIRAGAWPQTLLIRAERDSWVEIRDESDLVLHMGLVRSASPLKLLLNGPVRYTIGNSAGTLVEFAGQSIDLAPHTQPGTNIAKGSLP